MIPAKWSFRGSGEAAKSLHVHCASKKNAAIELFEPLGNSPVVDRGPVRSRETPPARPPGLIAPAPLPGMHSLAVRSSFLGVFSFNSTVHRARINCSHPTIIQPRTGVASKRNPGGIALLMARAPNPFWLEFLSPPHKFLGRSLTAAKLRATGLPFLPFLPAATKQSHCKRQSLYVAVTRAASVRS